MPRSPICRTVACCTTSGSRAAASASPRQRPRTRRLVLRDWRLERVAAGEDRSRYRARAASDSAGFRFDLELAASQPLLLQGVRGISRKGPDAAHFSRYYSEPQLRVRGTLALHGGEPIAVAGRAWLDHEWSDALLAPEAVGWDWIGMNLDDGGALTAFRLRRRDGTTLWAGGSHRPAGGAVRDFAPSEVVFAAGRRWSSPASKAAYPVEWTVTTPVGVFSVAAMQDDQELDSRASTGSIYWEGLSRLRDAAGRAVGSGYLEMTGYAGRLQALVLARFIARPRSGRRSRFGPADRRIPARSPAGRPCCCW